jgi:GNAT superfamily N-acetyltransferase
VRLAALTESPAAFAVSVEDEAARRPEEWEQWAADGASGSETATFIAVSGQAFVGLAAGFRHSTIPVAAHLVAMWVTPEHRGRAIGADLARAVIAWAAEAGFEAVTLWVVVENVPARTLYRNLGFRPTGDAQPLPSDPGLIEERWELPLH